MSGEREDREKRRVERVKEKRGRMRGDIEERRGSEKRKR